MESVFVMFSPRTLTFMSQESMPGMDQTMVVYQGHFQCMPMISPLEYVHFPEVANTNRVSEPDLKLHLNVV